MGDFGSTTFGYLIAYFMPGFVASVGAGFLSDNVGGVFTKVIDQQNLPLALMGAVGALVVGLFLSLIRAIVFEELVWRSSRLSADDYTSLAENEDKFRAYDRFSHVLRAAVEGWKRAGLDRDRGDRDRLGRPRGRPRSGRPPPCTSVTWCAFNAF